MYLIFVDFQKNPYNRDTHLHWENVKYVNYNSFNKILHTLQYYLNKSKN